MTSCSHEVDIWWANLAESRQTAGLLHRSGLVSEQERVRAARFRFDRDRDVYLASHALLRLILQPYLQCDASSIQFSAGLNGKPAVAGSDVSFNMSVSLGCAVYAVAVGCEVGIDVERSREIRGMDRVFMSFASQAEKTEWSLLSAESKRDAFMRWWTRKEAVVKALGLGVGLSLKEFDVSFGSGNPAAVRGFMKQISEPAKWTLIDISPDGQTIAALAAMQPGVLARCRHWPEAGGVGGMQRALPGKAPALCVNGRPL